jgi:hypothetical protein
MPKPNKKIKQKVIDKCEAINENIINFDMLYLKYFSILKT